MKTCKVEKCNTNHFGYYTNLSEATYVRDQIALQIYGKDAKLNIGGLCND